ncbi:MAG: hypothetical protein JWM59_1056 [Verrucomicrobiales bacterium]|nr:hypothetical protein [Verrucomicrobiales bacterium]
MSSVGPSITSGDESAARPDSELQKMEMDMGLQPLDALLEADGMDNHALVAVAVGTGLTHKVVQKARKGRQLTARAQKKVLAALNGARKTRDLPSVGHSGAFNYIGR